MILGHLGCVFDVTEENSGDSLILQIHTKDPGRLIGRDGRTLDDLQFLVNRLANLEEDEVGRIIVDVEGYREELHHILLEDVEKAADRVCKTGRPVMLQPLNSYDRRIVHNRFKQDKHVMSVSPNGQHRMKQITLKPRQQTPHSSGQTPT